MWRSFLSSIGLLTIAMMAALYSSGATRNGRLTASAVAALISLSIAVWVGVRFVPRLASGIEWGWLPFFSHYQLRREGWIYLGALAVVIFAAINTNNNLLYMVLSALLAVMLLSGFLSGLNFRCLQVRLRMPSRCFAGEAFPVSIQVKNSKRVFPTFSLRIGPAKARAIALRPIYFPVIEAQETASHATMGTISRRGHYKLDEVAVSSRYPFAFFSRQSNYRAIAECICYPQIMPEDQLDLSVLGIQGSGEQFERGVGQDLYLIRDYLPSDSARHVHWKASAKTGALKTREYAAEGSHRVLVALDRFSGGGDPAGFEKLVSTAASAIVHLVNSGVEIALVSDEWESGYGNSEALLEATLEYLAIVERSETAERPQVSGDDGTLLLSLR